MAGGKSWIRSALATVFSQWHFHLDLLDLWRNELASTSLALFVMGVPDDLATYQKMLAYYEQLITLFAFDTGYDPLVCIYDGEIRSTPWLYEFFSASPIYRDVSDRYYNSKLEDVNTQFTEQFLSNLALFWTVIIPDIFAHMGASAPQAIFESKANKLISLRKTTLANAGDFIKWMSHNYSLALKNYAPFVASPELWRAYNPFIDLYWWTIYGHIMCLRAFQSIEASRRIKPFIETQKTVITVNGQEYAETRLTGDGEITICIPQAELLTGLNKICFNSYNVISCVENLILEYHGFTLPYHGFSEDSPKYIDIKLDISLDTGLSMRAKGAYSAKSFRIGVNFRNKTKLPINIKFSYEMTPGLGATYMAAAGNTFVPYYTTYIDYITGSPSGTVSFKIPPREYFAVFIMCDGYWSNDIWVDMKIFDIEASPDDPDSPGPYHPRWPLCNDLNPYRPNEF